MSTTEQRPSRVRTYHHGDLARALAEAGVELARTGGPDAVVLREVARRVGVSPTAAYRHYAGQADLVHAVKERCLEALSVSMRAALAEVPHEEDPATLARERMKALGRAYFAFACSEVGMFACLHSGMPVPEDMVLDAQTPAFGELTAAIEALAAAGQMPTERRAGAEIFAWSTIHGLAVLCTDGPLQALPEAGKAELLEGVIQMILRGLIGVDPS